MTDNEHQQYRMLEAERDAINELLKNKNVIITALKAQNVILRAAQKASEECDGPTMEQVRGKPLTAWMDNTLAARLGAVALAAGARTDGMAEHIDFGLRLRRLLEESGFEIHVIETPNVEVKDGALDGGWTAVGMSAYAAKLEQALKPFANHPEFQAPDDWPVTVIDRNELTGDPVAGVTAGDFRRAKFAMRFATSRPT